MSDIGWLVMYPVQPQSAKEEAKARIEEKLAVRDIVAQRCFHAELEALDLAVAAVVATHFTLTASLSGIPLRHAGIYMISVEALSALLAYLDA